MSGATEPARYHVTYSARVIESLKASAARARARGDGEAFLAALREFDRRLHIYPQFGDPLSDLQQEEGHVRVGTIPPLVMRYGVLEERREVFVSALPALMAKSPASG